MSVLDRAHFDHMTGADRALQAEIVALFRSQAEGWVLASADAESWRMAVHTLKGSARGIGLVALAAACEAAEAAPEAQRLAALDGVRRALKEAQAALDQLAADPA